jgi:hypothetical protein
MLRQHPPDQWMVANPANVMLGCLSGPFGEFVPGFRHHQPARPVRLVARAVGGIQRRRREPPVFVHLITYAHEFPERHFGLTTTNQELALRSLQTGNTRRQSESTDDEAYYQAGNVKSAGRYKTSGHPNGGTLLGSRHLPKRPRMLTPTTHRRHFANRAYISRRIFFRSLVYAAHSPC